MLFIESECPHCCEKRGFKLFAVSEYRAQGTASEIIKRQKVTYTGKDYADAKNSPASFYAAGTCVYCAKAILLELYLTKDIDIYALLDHIAHYEKVYNGPLPKIKEIYPKPIPPYSHPSFPEKLKNLFVDLQIVLKQKLMPSAVIVACRSVLEEAVRELGGNGDTLHRRIADLKGKSILNGVLYEWAIAIKNLGNAAAHELSGSQEEADELVEFTKLFLQYTFEFPARVKELRSSH
jgi:hypothetical protein